VARYQRGQPTHTIDIAGVSVRVTRKRIKTLRLTVHSPDGDVRVSAPLSVPTETIRSFVESRLDWVERHRARIRAAPKPADFDYVSGEQLPFDGRTYPLLVVHQSGRPRVTLRDGELLVMAIPPDADRSQRERTLHAWYRAHLEAVVPPMIAAWEPRLGVSLAEWRIRRMKTRWGTCSIRARRIWLNLDLATKPRDCLEYLIVHELVHLLEPSHNARFKALMDRYLPNWRELRKRLNQGDLRQDD
jgi:predicted metal-dependent hydrolase